MKILLVSDEESKYLWDFYTPGKLDGIDLIISCGDLAAEYLSFLVTMCNAPVLYIHGNHDGKYQEHPPEGCVCIEDRIVTIGGLRILGLGGSQRYSNGPHQYTEAEMAHRVWKMRWKLLLTGGVDLVVTHAPVRGLGDDDSRVHRGFQAFHKLLKHHKPRYWAYGHMHMSYGASVPRVLVHGNTKLINACERYVLEVE